MKLKKILITGGLGFIGSNLINILIDKKKYKIVNIDKVSYSSNFYNVHRLKKNKNYKFYKADIGNSKKIYRILKKEKPDAIFNLAAETHVDRSIDDPYPFIKNNIISTFKFLEIFKNYVSQKPKVKLIHISTDEVYGSIIRGRSNEKHFYSPSSPYAASKAASDCLINSYIKTYNLPIITTKCSNNYGPRQHPEKLIPKLIYNILNQNNLPIYGKGKNSREWIYVEDHCKALIQIFKKGKVGETYNIGSNYNLNNLKIAKLLLNISKNFLNLKNEVKINFVKDRPGHDFRYALDSHKIKKKIKWKPTVSIEEGLKKTIKWYIVNKQYFKLIKKSDFTKRLGLK